MRSVLYVGCPPLERRDAEQLLGSASVSVIWADDAAYSLRIPPKTMSRSALSLIAALPWRGNASELRTLLEAVVNSLHGGRGIGLDDVLAHVRLDGGSVVFPSGGTLKQARARFEREYIATLLEQQRGRISEAAKVLGIQRTNLYRKMRSLRVARGRGV